MSALPSGRDDPNDSKDVDHRKDKQKSDRTSKLYVQPSFGPLMGGTRVAVTLSGVPAGFGQDYYTLKINNILVPCLQKENASICTIPPSKSAGLAHCEMHPSSSKSPLMDFEGDFMFLKAEQIEKISLRTLQDQIRSVEIQGHNFWNSRHLMCKFGFRHSVSAVWVSSTLVTCPVPHIDAPPQGLNLTVQISNNGIDFSTPSEAARFMYTSLRPIAKLQPTTGLTSETTRVLITGQAGFGGRIAQESGGQVLCQFGSSKALGGRVLDAGIECDAESGIEGKVSVRVSTDGGRSWEDWGLRFEFVKGIDIARVDPSTGPVAGGTRVTIVMGQRYDSESSGLSCMFGQTPSAGVAEVLSSGELVCVAPAAKTEAIVKVYVLSDGQIRSTGSAFRYRHWPKVMGLGPRSGPASRGQTITLQAAGGSWGLEDPAWCRVSGGQALSAAFMTESLMTCRLPPHGRGNATIEASFNGRDWVEVAGRFEYRERCLITGVEPSLGLMGGITSVTLTGVGLKGLGKSRCRIGSSWGSRLLEVSDALVICGAPEGGWGSVMPPGDVGEADGGRVKGLTVGLMLEGASQEACEMKEAYFLYSPLRIDSVSPSSLVQGRQTVVTVVGQTFDEARRVGCKYSEAAGASLQSGASWDTQEGTVITSSMALCKSPQMSGKSEDLSLQVSYDGGQLSSSRLSIRYIPEPTITRLEPSAGSSAGGQVITVIGSNMRASRSGTYCLFGNRGQMPALHVTTSAVKCLSPFNSKGANVSFSLQVGEHIFSTLLRFYSDLEFGFALGPSMGPVRGNTQIRFLTSFNGPLYLEDERMNCSRTDSFLFCLVLPLKSFGNRIQPLDVSIRSDQDTNHIVSRYTYYQEEVVSKIELLSVNQFANTCEFIVYGENFVPSSKMMCKTWIDGDYHSISKATAYTNTEVACTLTNVNLSSRISIQISNNGVDFSSASATYTYERAPTVTSLSLLALDGSSGQVEQDHGRTVRVIGKHFVASPQLRCSLPGVARYITSSMVDCVSGGGRVGGNLTVEVSNNGQDWSSGGLGLLAWEDTPRFSEEVQLEPTMGPSRGGTQVTVRLLGAEGLQGVSLSLQVGLEGSAECRYQSGTEYRCQMPEVRSTTNRVLSRYTGQRKGQPKSPSQGPASSR
ncbi:hypothetical protein GUITHDRAFT_122871 [Guillardia theta CCMP2712]|uniref:IPT/TIG domain-containing protein n=1 Tax=Guillardia theta (strain CCMP2712) TaxID=905079 RepID=L1I3X1_GUITC|nr:hypothetical protein GUITHDRAFT_122871 [Guillardia theta CCMP2712]EKX30921.1 hypothetical protein GUITHDRAFT_122871 [Guillardia theta CCMP2712]|eukprot:XP_005817901.1 hypothetical protein GUITHDRAFT_122871 [Guillardia theta CCMP2712]